MACPILPAELWVSIFSHLGFRQIIKSQEVCRSFSDIISSSSLLQYLIRLGVYGYVDLPLKYRLNIPDRLAYLQKYHSEWRIPKLQHRETIQLEHEIPARARWYPEKFHDGVLAVGHKDDGGYPPYHEDWKTEFHFMFNQISLFRLDTAGDPRYIKYELGDFFGLFDFDVPEDVLVVARCPASPRSSQVLLKAFSLSQDSAHRRSHVREIIVPCYSSAITKFRVCGELVAFSTRSPGVIVVNWTTGSFRTIALSPCLSVASDLCFISTTHLAVSDGWSHHPRLQIFSLERPSLDGDIDWIVLELPKIFPTLTIEKDRMMSSLSRGNGQDQYPSDPDLDRLLFQPSPVRADLLCTHITVSSLAGNEEEDAYYHRKPGSHTYTAVISVPGILNMLVASPTSLLSWDSWGPPLCRWFQDLDLVSQDDLHTPISGPRMILKDCILDFNAVEIARDFSQCRCRVPAAHWTDVHGQYPDASPNFYCEEHKAVVTRPSTVPCGVAFTNRVTTGLPYRKVMEFCQSRRLRESDWTYMSASLVRRVDEDGTIVFHFLDL